MCASVDQNFSHTGVEKTPDYDLNLGWILNDIAHTSCPKNRNCAPANTISPTKEQSPTQVDQ